MADDGVLVGGGGKDYAEARDLLLHYANRHGLITGATGTGKTVTLQILAEGLSAAGVPVFVQDAKGDISGLSRAGDPAAKQNEALIKRAAQVGMTDFAYRAYPVVFWDLFGQSGHPVRTTVTEMGPLLLARMMELSEPQEGVLNIAFRVADEQGLPLLDLKDLQALLVWLGENAAAVGKTYGNIATASLGAIQRALLVLENQGAGAFSASRHSTSRTSCHRQRHGPGQRADVRQADAVAAALRDVPALAPLGALRAASRGRRSGEAGARLLLRRGAPPLRRRSQGPRRQGGAGRSARPLQGRRGLSLHPEPRRCASDVLSQLGNRVQHALRAFTPRDAKALKQAAETFRANPDFDTETAIREVGTGEAVVSLLEDKGVPAMVSRTLIRPPKSRLGPVTAAERTETIAASPLAGKYDTAVDRDSAQEILAGRADKAAKEAALAEDMLKQARAQQADLKQARRYEPAAGARSPARAQPSIGSELARAAVKQLNSRQGQALVRGILGSLFKGR